MLVDGGFGLRRQLEGRHFQGFPCRCGRGVANFGEQGQAGAVESASHGSKSEAEQGGGFRAAHLLDVAQQQDLAVLAVEADLYISIHANSSPIQSAASAET